MRRSNQEEIGPKPGKPKWGRRRSSGASTIKNRGKTQGTELINTVDSAHQPATKADVESSTRTIAQLLVSVRNADEARAATAGGADIIDVKEPSRGPLGPADAKTICEIVDAVRQIDPAVPVSIALDEVIDRQAFKNDVEFLPAIDFFKFGVSRLTAGSDAENRLRDELHRIIDLHSQSGTPAPRGIVVAYADFESAGTAPPEIVLQWAVASGYSGLLVDTFDKRNGRLVDCLSVDRLSAIGRQCRAVGLKFGLAGRLQVKDLPRVVPAGPDVVGIRSAACRGGSRLESIDRAAVQEFQRALFEAGC